MNNTEYLLTKVIEECVELVKACTKAQRFGLTDKHPETGELNKDAIVNEFLDITAVMYMLIKKGDIGNFNCYFSHLKGRIAKTKKYMEYSRKRGTLRD